MNYKFALVSQRVAALGLMLYAGTPAMAQSVDTRGAESSSIDEIVVTAMTIPTSPIDLTDFRHRLTADGYSRHTIRTYVSTVRAFQQDLDKCGIAVDTIDSSHVSAYLKRRLARYKAVHLRGPRSLNRWRSQNHGGIHSPGRS